MKPNAKGKTAYDLVTDADAKAALRSRPFIFFSVRQAYNSTTAVNSTTLHFFIKFVSQADS